MSPEILNKNHYGAKSDLWSVGIILYELITGHTPYINAKNMAQLKTLMNQSIDLKPINRTHISFSCYDLLNKLLNKEKHNRINWQDFFNHDWFSTNMLLDFENRIIEEPLNYELLQNIEPMFRENVIPLSSNVKSNIVKTISNDVNTINNVPIQSTKLNTALQHTNTQLKISNSQLKNELKLIGNYDINLQQDSRHQKSKSKLLSQFTFNLKSSQLTDDSQNKSITNSNSGEINLSDLKQDDLPHELSHELQTVNYTTTVSKPIDIINRNKSCRHNISKSVSTSVSTSVSPSTSSSNITNTPSSYDKKNDISTFSPKNLHYAVSNSFKFLKETYEYLNTDNKSI
jgi:hypothetical protein